MSGSQTTPVEHGRWHDIAKLLAFIWAVSSSLVIATSFSVIPLADPSATGPLWATCAAVATLAPWVVVFLVWRWPTIGALALLAGFFLYLVFVCRPPELSFWAFLLFWPTLLTLPTAVALAVHLERRRATRLATDGSLHRTD